MVGTPLKNLFPNGLCEGTNRRGRPCGVRLDVRRCKNGRLLCRWHGGWSTGPRTPDGKARCGEAGRRNLKAWHARRKG
ncbi:MAG: HGGxSTG domain-containing protein [Casimicrobiaceae bacterium]